MKTLIQIFMILSFIACGYLAFLIFMGIGMGDNFNSFKFLIPVAVAFFFTFLGFGYFNNNQYGSAFLIGVLIPLLLIIFTFYWNKNDTENRQEEISKRVHENCEKVTDPGSPNGFGYYYLCRNGQIVYSVK